jgi:hypothetical protein
MYLLMVLALAVVLPIVSIIIELLVVPGSDPLLVVGKWFVFWGAGIRLFTAGISQIFRPQFTAKNLLGIDAPGVGQIVQELGFANTAIGLAGILSLFIPGWAVPVAAIAGVFLLLAGIRHAMKPKKTTQEWIPLITDFVIAIVLLVFAVISIVRQVA